MIKHIFMLSILLITAGYTKACDVCGCGVNTSYFGVMPQGNGHFLGLRYGQASFNASMVYDSPLLEDEFSNDLFHRIDLLGNTSITDQIQLAVSVPYIINSMHGSHQSVTFQGVGDVAVLGYFKPDLMGGKVSKFQQTLFLGGGVEMPTGNSDRESGEVLINRNFQLGSGSWDFLLSTNYSLVGSKYGLNIEGGYRINTESASGYQFGNQWSTSLNFFRYVQGLMWSFTPFVGSYMESSAAHYDGLVEQHNTGGWAVMANAGAKITRKTVSMEMTYQLPLTQEFQTDQFASINANRRFSVMVGLNF